MQAKGNESEFCSADVRRFVVTRNGEKKGDDIIIYDRERSPTLRLVEQNGFERKESIPVESVYAYIEAKSRRRTGRSPEIKCSERYWQDTFVRNGGETAG